MSSKEHDYDIVPPAASAMIESLRAYGYSPSTAIADIIDNSITANARNVWIQFQWAGEDSYISILDDGCGMDEESLINAMRPGSRSPLEERDSFDLGRFGMGLKTASFSQCRRVTVRSKTTESYSCIRRWDLDHVAITNEWQLLKSAFQGSQTRMQSLDQLPTGTIVLWENMDRLLGQVTEVHSNEDQDRFLSIVDDVIAYLEMVFHNYLEGINPLLKIFVNGRTSDHQLKPWDPFYESNPATTLFPEETIHHSHGVTTIKGYVLPHKDKMLADDLLRAAGFGGWNARQGFYIYRNKRLLVAGGWLGLGDVKTWNQEEQYKLARIRIDISNSLDFDWLIDIKKSTAKPPAWIRRRITALAGKVRNKAREVFAYRGAYVLKNNVNQIKRIWKTQQKNGRLSYRIDKDHYLVQAMNSITLTQIHKDVFKALIRTLEETVPIASIWLDTAENADNHARPFENYDESEKRHLIQLSYNILRQKNGLTSQAARQKLKEMEAFQDFLYLIDEQKD
jgi:hypothetical protein